MIYLISSAILAGVLLAVVQMRRAERLSMETMRIRANSNLTRTYRGSWRDV